MKNFYILIFINHGKNAGAVIDHPQVNMISFSNIPPGIDAEAEAYHRILNEKGVCPMCQTINTEMGGPREDLQTAGFVACCTWAPSHRFEFCL